MRVHTSRAGGAQRPRRGLGTALLTSAAIAAVVVLVSTAAFALSASGQSTMPFLHAQPGAVRWNTHDRLNMLLLGTTGGGQLAQVDSMVIASFDPGSQTAALMSLPPNLWVTIPGFGPGPISETYGDGGVRLSLLVAQSVVHVPIPYFAVARTDTFRQIVDAFGGVTLPSSRQTVGGRRSNRLNGPAALAYADGLAPGSAGQMRRQRDLLLALRRQGSQSDTLLRLPNVLNTLGGSVSTNFPYDQVPYLAKMLAQIPDSSIRSVGLDATNGAVSPYHDSGTVVSVADWQRIRAVAQGMLPDPKLASSAPVQVVNASGVPGRATALAAWLRRARLRAAPNLAAVSLSYPHTEVVLRPDAGERQRYAAEAVAALLRVPVVTAAVPKGGAKVALIIGHDFQDLAQP